MVFTDFKYLELFLLASIFLFCVEQSNLILITLGGTNDMRWIYLMIIHCFHLHSSSHMMFPFQSKLVHFWGFQVSELSNKCLSHLLKSLTFVPSFLCHFLLLWQNAGTVTLRLIYRSLREWVCIMLTPPRRMLPLNVMQHHDSPQGTLQGKDVWRLPY